MKRENRLYISGINGKVSIAIFYQTIVVKLDFAFNVNWIAVRRNCALNKMNTIPMAYRRLLI